MESTCWCCFRGRHRTSTGLCSKILAFKNRSVSIVRSFTFSVVAAAAAEGAAKWPEVEGVARCCTISSGVMGGREAGRSRCQVERRASRVKMGVRAWEAGRGGS